MSWAEVWESFMRDPRVVLGSIKLHLDLLVLSKSLYPLGHITVPVYEFMPLVVPWGGALWGPAEAGGEGPDYPHTPPIQR